MYKITIQLKGSNEEKIIEATSHSIIEPQLFSIIGKDKRRYLIPLSSISCLEFDKRLDKILTTAKKEE